jgi:hypothetical protein
MELREVKQDEDKRVAKEVLCDFYSPPDTIKMLKSRRVR